ncbi:proline--tRNA ligase [Actinospica sp. MGRD01-02]|uniref:Proline--tRNA ligase n=1 Tax=Actinospica acidithermotolerans TaxID=2828514 RepID=A0A941E955_9ACTN|nr:proline--tRNA ligase [Actinospica acidithermotolerans]MBR7824859.1 proline--tRNA ligase [Actinospica acidithermotolerans]
MVTRMSSLFLRTLRDDPADAEVPSHKLLVRAGYVRRVAPGIYSWLPLGKIVLDNIARVVKEEMDRIGAQEVQFPALLPREFYEATGRWTEYGENLFRLRDRKGGDYLLGPTHEEMFTLMVKGEYSSYKDLPVILYQIQNKYRDEARPRAGILRGREFLMKDSYSFDLDDEGLKRSYELHREAYIRIFTRLGMNYRIVSAMSGAMGGSASEEFLAPAATGEDTFVQCVNCDYAANTEAVEGRPGAEIDASATPAARVYDTPDTPTIESLVEVFRGFEGFEDTAAANTLKNVVVKLRVPGKKDAEVLIVGVPGDRDVDMKRLEAAVAPAEIELFEAEDFAKHPALVRGYIGPQGLAEAGYTYKVDPLVVPGSSWITGANEAGKHAAHVTCGRDFTPEGTVGAAEVRAGDACPRCGGALSIDRGIEIGHIFQLGRKYADAFQLDVLGPEGKPVRVTMGSYGVGVSRAVAAVVEQTYDERGIVWPREIAPADVHLVATGKDDAVFEAAADLAAELDAAGVRVIFDDRRKVSPGVKLKDAELIGVPTVAVVGKGLAEGVIEVQDRATGEKRDVPLGEAVAALAV